MAFSSSTTNVRRYHVDTAVSKLIADLHAGLLIKVLVELIAMASASRCRIFGDLLVAFACVGRPQLVEASEVVRMEDIPCGADDLPLKI